jgi:DNA-binding MarR family transcriptional regulator/ribosomal protein S18 acetylase RimI-like enzyme
VDLLADVGELALASRLRRLSETLMKDASALYQDLGLAFEPRWFPLFHLLGGGSAVSVGRAASRLGLTHTAVGQVARQLARAGLVRLAPDRRDERRRLLTLTAAGRRLRRRLDPVWKEIRRSAREVLAESGVDLLEDVARVERVLGERSVMDRVRVRLGLAPRGILRIADYRPAYKKHFKSLNEAWLTERFSVEEEDARILNDPNRVVIRRGGRILFALVAGEVVGTCALVRHGARDVELCKMAVAPAFRKRGFGTALACAAVEKARAMGVPRLYLRTSPALADARRLYRRLGFKTVRRGVFPAPDYARKSITMVLDLTRGRRPALREVSP